jgi:hypothetical protein
LRNTGRSRPSPQAVPELGWIRALAAPYLRGYRARVERKGNLRGWRFEVPRLGANTRAGFFVGYLVAAQEFSCLAPHPPECLVFAFVEPIGGPLHRCLVAAPDSLLRKTFTYIRWLTHRLPRLAFFEDQPPAMVRHLSMCEWPPEKYEHLSRNFFIEVCCWLVRSGLVCKLLAECAAESGLPGPTHTHHAQAKLRKKARKSAAT